jgi:ABC-type multidrug transport system ATPase subunit
MSSDKVPIQIEWKNIKYTVQTTAKDSKTKVDKEILHNLAGFANNGEFLGIIGSSGSGKTTLLNMLRGNIKADEGAIVTANG